MSLLPFMVTLTRPAPASPVNGATSAIVIVAPLEMPPPDPPELLPPHAASATASDTANSAINPTRNLRPGLELARNISLLS